MTVADLAFGGRGVSRVDGFVVFTPDTAPGDRARVRIRKARRRFAEADLVEVLEPGPGRMVPPCAFVPACGGCRLQHVDYDEVLEAKRQQVAEHLARIGGLEGVDVLDADPALERFGYRNKMEYSAAPGPDGELRLGFHRRGRWDEVVDIDPCMLATEAGIRNLRGQWHAVPGLPGVALMSTFDPETLLQHADLKRGAWDDLKKVMTRLGLTPPR